MLKLVAPGDTETTGRLSGALFARQESSRRMTPRHFLGGKPAPKQATKQIGEALLEHVASLRRYAILLLGSITDADDAVQETLAKILGQGKALSEVRDLRSYMFAALHNVCIDDARRQRRSAGLVPIEDVIGTLASPATQHKRLELRDLAVALAKLPLEQREVILLVGLEGMSYADAAQTLDVPVGTIMSRLSRGREALRQLTARSNAPRLRIVK